MNATIDHIVLAATSLDKAKSQWHARTGLRAVNGGRHPGVGTQNALCGLAEGTYVELLAVDPTQPDHRQPNLPAELSPFHWAVAVDDLTALEEILDRRGVSHTGAINMSRETTTGETLRWRLLFALRDSAGGGMPFFIDWLNSEHPSANLGSHATLAEITVCAPNDSAALWLLPKLGLARTRVTTGSPRLEFGVSLVGEGETPGTVKWTIGNPSGFQLG